MQLSKSDKQSLVLGLADALRQAECSDWGTFFDEDWQPPTVSENLHKTLNKVLDRGGIAQFAQDRVHRMILSEGVTFPYAESISLCDLHAFADPAKVAESIVDELETLPWNYKILVRGPRAVSAGPKRNPFKIKIAEQFWLISSEHLKEDFTFSQSDPILEEWVWIDTLDQQKRFFANNFMYFYQEYKGYIGKGRNSRATDFLEDEIRAFYGSCLAYGLMRPYPYYYPDAQSFVYLASRDGSPLEPHGSMSSDVSNANYYMPGFDLRIQFRALSKLEAVLLPVISLFNCKTHSRLKTAAIWLLRAEQSEKPLDKVLEAAIALEVLLGDREMSDKLGLTKLMANRCAYALGTSSSDRDEMLQFFFDFYKLRSEIVHTGRLAMDPKEAKLVRRGLELVSSMLRHERWLSCTDS